MSSKRGGLGKGLSSLIPTDVGGDEAGPYREIDISSIVPNQLQPRSQFDEEALASLSSSIAEVGVIQPVIVRPASDGTHELIAGERRWRAAKRAGLQSIPALVRPTDAKGGLEAAIVENLHRQDLNPLEEAAAYCQLIEDFRLSQKAVAKRVGRSRSAVANTIRLLQLAPGVQRLLADGRLSAGHGRALLTASDPALQEALAKRAADGDLSVRAVEELLRDDGRAAGEEPGSQLSQGQAEAPGTDPQGAPDKHPRPASAHQAGVLELEDLLSSRLDTTVKIHLGSGPGRLVVSFADLDDLERIYNIITPHNTI